MFNPYQAFIGLRYVRAKRRNHFISFISLTSMIGVALGVMALIVVLSVMNGFEKELTTRILGMASHAAIYQQNNQLEHWQMLAEKTLEHDGVEGVAPFYNAEGMLINGQQVNGALIRGVLPNEEPQVSVVSEKMQIGSLDALLPGEYGIILGVELANALGVMMNDKVTLVAPQANVTPAGVLPRLKRFTVKGIFEIGMHEFDSAVALIHLEDSKKLFRDQGRSGLRIKTNDILQAPLISREIQKTLPGAYAVVDWTQRHKNFFQALKTEKLVMFIILTLIVAVAAFNIISTLVMVVTDKQADIAVLRTLGASPKDIMQIFMIQGLIIGLVGITLGVIGGLLLALNLENLVAMLEQNLGIEFLPSNVYYISDLPSEVDWTDITVITIIAFLFCLLATLYPSLRAAKTQPAEALRYE